MQDTITHRPAQPFWDRIAPKYALKPVPDPAAYEDKLAQVAARLRPTDRVLEIGCGTGSTALRLAPGVAHVTATDASRGMIAIAQSKLGPGAPDNVTFRLADAAETVAGAPFDAICAFSLLHLIEDVPQVLGSVRRQLKPGGLFLSKTACLRDRNAVLRTMVPALVALGVAPRVTPLGADQLVSLMRRAGFEVEQRSYLGSNRMSPFIVARRTGA